MVENDKSENKGAPGENIEPPIDNVIQRSYEALKDGRLLGFKCKKCNTYGILAMGYSCPHCGSFELEELELSGKGKLHPCSTVVYPMAGVFEEPYIAATVELDEGPLITGRLYDLDDFDFDEPKRIFDLIGMDIEIDIRRQNVLDLEEQYCVCFVPAKKKK